MPTTYLGPAHDVNDGSRTPWALSLSSVMAFINYHLSITRFREIFTTLCWPWPCVRHITKIILVDTTTSEVGPVFCFPDEEVRLRETAQQAAELDFESRFV